MSLLKSKGAMIKQVICVCILLTHISKTIAQSNAPASTGSTPAATGAVSPNIPSAYSSGAVKNYIRTWMPQQPFADEVSVMTNSQVEQVNRATQYIDGLGRAVQTINWQASPLKKDIIAPSVYDEVGREQYKYLGYTDGDNNGLFRSNPFSDQYNFYSSVYPADQPAINGEQFFYSHTQFEPSPLNRAQKNFAPGNTWAGSEGGSAEASVQMQYLVNNDNDGVRIWTIASDALTYSNNDIGTNIPLTSSTYSSGTLYKSITIDEHNHAIVEYKDLEGQVILKKVQVDNSISADFSGHTGFLCTYYVYDELNRLRFVIPPKAVAALIVDDNWELDPSVISELCFRYEYSPRQLMTAKKIPGAGWVYMIYDQRDRLVFTQDGNMKINNQWLGTLYDVTNRNVETGMLTYTGNPADLQNYVDANTTANTTGSQSTSGNTPSSIPVDLIVTTRQVGQTSYQAVSSINFNAGFTSDDAAEFETQITNGDQGTFTNTVEVLDNPLPSGSNFIPLTITNYDTYSNTTKTYDPANNSKLDQGTNPYAESLPDAANPITKGLVTSTRVRVIENPADLSQGQWLDAATFYDDKDRPVQVQSTNYKNGLDVMTRRYDFINKIVCTYQVHNNPAGNISNLRIKTNMNYDHEGRLLTAIKNINDDADASSPQTTQRNISTHVYDALGMLKEKGIGQTAASGSSFSETPLEDDNYAYNIRGWFKGINWQGYGGSATYPLVNAQNNKWFGMDLSYDWGFATNQLNGNISGQRWMNASDGAERSYGYGYDNVNRLLSADFNQRFGDGDGWSKDDPGNSNFHIDFSVAMGDGVNYNSAYDENGNIKAMQQNGLVLNSSQPIDNLVYTYANSSNKLSAVTDGAIQPVGMKLGDFTDNNTSGDDYGYDVNGNLVTDKNKRIGGNTGIDQTGGGIIYNHLNLPFQVTMQNADGLAKGSITYIYDATGNKLEKRTNELPSTSNNGTGSQTTTTYISNFQYQNNVLQFFGQEEGRIRPVIPNDYNNGQQFAYDYIIKDHLGNTRVLLTDELEQHIYPAATLEDGGYTVENTYYNINQGHIVNTPEAIAGTHVNNNEILNPDPGINTSANSEKMYRLNGASGDKTGLGITLKVMAGDNVSIFGQTYWQNTDAPPVDNSYNIVINDLLTLIAGSSAIISPETGITADLLTGSPVTPGELSDLLANRDLPSDNQPKAYINWVLFDEQFRPAVTGTGSGFDPVGPAGELTSHGISVDISKSGYLYVYCSNESNTDVLFDNLQVVQTKGPLLETTDYYPFGLSMAGISSKVLKSNYPANKFKFNGGNELQNQEFSNGDGLELYDANHRLYDPQIGKFLQIDELSEVASIWTPYAFANDNPINNNDPNGLETTALSSKSKPQKKHGFTPDDPNVLSSVVVRHAHSIETLKNTYWRYIDRQIPFDQAPRDIRNWLSQYNDLQIYLNVLHSYIREEDDYAINIGSFFIPIGELKIFSSALKLFKFRKGVAAGRVFWSGYYSMAGKAAKQFARSNGMQTLEMTSKGKVLEFLTKMTSRDFMSGAWERASANFANGAEGSVHVFHNAVEGIPLDGAWRTIEYPILKDKGVEIIYHNVH